jgi:hypothetical protein
MFLDWFSKPKQPNEPTPIKEPLKAISTPVTNKPKRRKAFKKAKTFKQVRASKTKTR